MLKDDRDVTSISMQRYGREAYFELHSTVFINWGYSVCYWVSGTKHE